MHYNVAYDPAVNDTFYLFSPETIMKISVTNTEDLIENLYIRKQYEAAFELISNTYTKPMLEKVQSGYFNHLILTGQTEKAKSVMVQFAGTDRDKWMHWLSKIMQKKKLIEFIDLIPAEKGEHRLPGAPKQVTLLPTSFYTTLFLHFIRKPDFVSLEKMV